MSKAPIAIRYATTQRFFGSDQKLLLRLQKELQADKERNRILSAQQDDGTWKLEKRYSLEERQKAIQFLDLLKKMYQLYEFFCTKENPAIQKALIALLKTQKPDGKFPLLFHHHGLALWLLVQYELTGNPFVEKGFRWITKRQRPDGGWISPTMTFSANSTNNTESDIWTTMVILEAFSQHTRLRNSDTCTAAAEFMLAHYLQPSTTTLLPGPDTWNQLQIEATDDGLFKGGTLRFLEAFAPLGQYHKKPPVKKALEWLIENQLDSGLFPPIVSPKVRQGDYSVTFRVMAVLDDFDRFTGV
jgi:hypothetical protein